MITNLGWCVFIVVQGKRRYVERFDGGEAQFTSEVRDAKFGDEYDARQLQQMVGRLYDDVRLCYVPFQVRQKAIDPWLLVG
jgi:hypothetical protein